MTAELKDKDLDSAGSSIRLRSVGKMYRLYRRPLDKVFDALGIGRLLFWRRGNYREFWALRGLDIEVRKGECLGIIGRNGAGKSTLLKIVTGNVASTEGRVEISGQVQALMELGTGFHPEFTGRQNIRASLAYMGLSATQIQDKEEEIIDFAELDKFIDQPVKTYSAGMYARLAFSTATAIEPEILIIDEVLGAGDAYFSGKCVERMRNLTKQIGATVLFVSHDMASVQQLCSRVIWIDKGRIRQSGEALPVIKAYMAVVRSEEELRIRAREKRLLRKQATVIENQADLYRKVLFHLVGADGTSPDRPARIYDLRLMAGDEVVCSIDVGGPMDNSDSHLSCVLDGVGYMDWGQPRRDTHGSFREFRDFGGRYRHAPFELAIPVTTASEPHDYAMEVTMESSSHIALEFHDGNSYQRAALLAPQDYGAAKVLLPTLAGFLLKSLGDSGPSPAASGPPEAPTVQNEDVPADSQYGSQAARITKVRLLDWAGRDKRVFETGEPLKVIVEIEAPEPISTPTLVFCVYLSDGRCASQWVADAEKHGRSEIKGHSALAFRVEKLFIGRGDYVASVGLFKRRARGGEEPPSYHVLDRCVSFKIVQNLAEDFNLGLCLQPFEVEWIDAGRIPS